MRVAVVALLVIGGERVPCAAAVPSLEAVAKCNEH